MGEESEYFNVMSYVRDHAPQQLLVWGLGFDALVYSELNRGGNTVFLEPSSSWAEALGGHGLEIYEYDKSLLKVSCANFKDFLRAPQRADCVERLSSRPCWDTVIIDSPTGECWSTGTRA